MKYCQNGFCLLRTGLFLVSHQVTTAPESTLLKKLYSIATVNVSSKLATLQRFKRTAFKIATIFLVTSLNTGFADPLRVPTARQAITISKSSIERVFENVAGMTRVNVTAGTGNIQQNSSAIAIISDNKNNAVAKIKSTQLTNNFADKSRQIMSAEIGQGAFNGTRGLASINQSAGVDNTQLNAMAIAVGGARPFAIVEMNESQLLGETQVAGFRVSSPAGDLTQDSAVTVLSTAAFQGAQGVIQLNQAAGRGNLTSNSFTMSVSK